MHSKLWEREVDTFFIEGFVNSFIGTRNKHPNNLRYLPIHVTTTFTLLASSA